MKISFLIPTYNDPEIATLVEDLRLDAELLIKENFISDFEIVISDDFSRSTFHLDSIVYDSGRVRLVRQSRNLGIVGNFRALYKLATYDLVAIVPGDGEWPPKEICRIIREKRNLDVSTMLLTVRTSRFPNYSLARKIISTLYNLFATFVSRRLILDLGSIKIFPRYLTENLVTDSLLSELELLINAEKMGLKIISTNIRNVPRVTGKSSVNLRVLIVACLREVTKIINARFNRPQPPR